MEDLNKITSTRVGDSIHFFVNGAEDSGTVVKMDTSYVTVVKRDGNFQDIHINDTFFIKDILVNKTWNDMTMEERTVELHKIHAYSPRFLAKSWKELPKELKDVMLEKTANGALPNPKGNSVSEPDPDNTKEGQATEARHHIYSRDAAGDKYNPNIGDTGGGNMSAEDRAQALGNTKLRGIETPTPSGGGRRNVTQSNVEQGHVGGGGRSGHAVETSTAFDAEEDYEGESHDTKEEQFKHDKEKPKVTNKTGRNNYGGNMEAGLVLNPSKIKELQELETDKQNATPTSETKYFGANGKQITREEHESSSDIKQSYGSMQEQLWEQWLDKDGGMGGGSPPASTSSNNSAQTNDSGVYNPVYGEKGRHGGQSKDKEEETEKDKEADEKERKG